MFQIFQKKNFNISKKLKYFKKKYKIFQIISKQSKKNISKKCR